MGSKFKKGDKVYLSPDSEYYKSGRGGGDPSDVRGVIKVVYFDEALHVDWPTGSNGYEDHDLLSEEEYAEIKPDWDNAPEGATHWAKAIINNRFNWFKQDCDKLYYWRCSWITSGRSRSNYPDKVDSFQARPEPEHPELDPSIIPEGYELTGEVKEPKEGEYFLSKDMTQGSPKPRIMSNKLAVVSNYVRNEGSRYIVRKTSPIEPPRSMEWGYEWTGELREVKEGDEYLGAGSEEPQPNDPAVMYKADNDLPGCCRYIVRKKIPNVEEEQPHSFKVGDKVYLRLDSIWNGTGDSNPTGTVGIITRILRLMESSLPVKVTWEGRSSDQDYTSEDLMSEEQRLKENSCSLAWIQEVIPPWIAEELLKETLPNTAYPDPCAVPEGYKPTGEVRPPKYGEFFIISHKENPDPELFSGITMAGKSTLKHATWDRYILEKIPTKEELDKTNPVYSLAEKIKYGKRLKYNPNNLFTKPETKTSQEDPMTTITRTLPRAISGNVKFIQGFVANDINKEFAHSLFVAISEQLKALEADAAADTAYIKDQIATLAKDKEELLKILNDKKNRI